MAMESGDCVLMCHHLFFLTLFIVYGSTTTIRDSTLYVCISCPLVWSFAAILGGYLGSLWMIDYAYNGVRSPELHEIDDCCFQGFHTSYSNNGSFFERETERLNLLGCASVV